MAHKLMVIDDQPIFREVVGDILAGHFDIVAEPETLEQVWADLQAHHPCGIIIDVNLDEKFRGRDGLQLARELLAAYPDLKIVLVSGFMEPAYEAVVRTLPGTTFMEKSALTTEGLRAALTPPVGERKDASPRKG